MSTIIYPSPVFGPIHSRRLGVSLGINLLPADGKVCTFDCIYCECGFNADHRPHLPLPTRAEVSAALERKLLEMKATGVRPDVLTFAGNGEPTVHPDFEAVIGDTIALRDRHFPEAKVSVLTNATQTLRESVHRALARVDNNILKLDTVSADYIRSVDRPQSKDYNVEAIISALSLFDNATIQTMFMKGSFEGRDVSNTGQEYVGPWLRALERIRPVRVMIYTIDRETPAHQLQKATHDELDSIAAQVRALGLECEVAY